MFGDEPRVEPVARSTATGTSEVLRVRPQDGGALPA